MNGENRWLLLFRFNTVINVLLLTTMLSLLSGMAVASADMIPPLNRPDQATLNPCQYGIPTMAPIPPNNSGSQGLVLDKFKAELQNLIVKYQDQGLQAVGLVVKDQTSQQIIQINASQVFVSASLYKLFVLWKLQVEINAGRLSDNTEIPVVFYDEEDPNPTPSLETMTVKEARYEMITYSDNTAAWSLAQTLDWNRIDELLIAHNFSISRTALSDPVTNASEIARFFEGVYNHNLDTSLSNKDYDLMLDLLNAQQVNIYLSQGLPHGTVFAHKTGSWDNLNHDAGIIYTPDGRVIFLTVLTEGNTEAAVLLMQEVAKLTWQTMAQTPLSRYFPETDKTVSDKFLEYWSAKGGLQAYGYPLTEARPELNQISGKTYLTQWFEHTRFELHLENTGSTVELGLLGVELCANAMQNDPNFLPALPLMDSSDFGTPRFFPTTKHNLSHPFLAFWEQEGGINRFGYPISEEHAEIDPESGKIYQVQWFERARFEYRPENAVTSYEILLGLLGRQALTLKENR